MKILKLTILFLLISSSLIQGVTFKFNDKEILNLDSDKDESKIIKDILMQNSGLFKDLETSDAIDGEIQLNVSHEFFYHFLLTLSTYEDYAKSSAVLTTIALDNIEKRLNSDIDHLQTNLEDLFYLTTFLEIDINFEKYIIKRISRNLNAIQESNIRQAIKKRINS